MNVLPGICIVGFFYITLATSEASHDVYRNVSSVKIKRLVERSGLTEGPHWDPITQKLFFVDIWANKLCSYNPENSEVYCAYIANGPVALVVPVQNTSNTFVIGSGADILLVIWNGESDTTNPPIQKLATADIFRPETRFNDGKADSSGRLWAGTMSEVKGNAKANEGVFYSLDKDLVLKTQINPVTISNGLAWNKEDDTLYYIDSPTKQIVGYDYNPQMGTIKNKKIVFDLQKNNLPGVPDGMTIDSDGNLWIALFGGTQVIQVNPKSGKLLRSIPMPATRITSMAFGGSLLDTLYVTTAGYGFSNPEEKTPADDLQGGSIFSIEGTGARGFPSNRFTFTFSYLIKRDTVSARDKAGKKARKIENEREKERKQLEAERLAREIREREKETERQMERMMESQMEEEIKRNGEREMAGANGGMGGYPGK